MHLDDLDYDLPADRIAQEPAARRDAARLLVVPPGDAPPRHAHVRDLAQELTRGDLLVVNDTRVIPARLRAERDTGGRVEVFLLEPVAEPEGPWRAMTRAGGRLRVGEKLRVAGGDQLTLVARPDADGPWVVASAPRTLPEIAARGGQMPLPPYIERTPDDPRDAMDRERYQTVFATAEGAVAAPTAGLHLSDGVLADLDARGIERATLTLHVGLGTFQPVRAQHLRDHVMHAESYTIPAATAEAVRAARREGRRVVAVGTTTVRALEASAAASDDGLPRAEATRTDLCIQPGHTFRAVDALLTNFHLPRSTLLALVAAFMGLEAMHAAYRTAIESGYRFYSYGDAMFLPARHVPSAHA